MHDCASNLESVVLDGTTATNAGVLITDATLKKPARLVQPPLSGPWNAVLNATKTMWVTRVNIPSSEILYEKALPYWEVFDLMSEFPVKNRFLLLKSHNESLVLSECL